MIVGMIKRAIPRMPVANTNSIVGAYVPAWHVAIGLVVAVIIGAGLPLGLLYWSPANAQTVRYNTAYVTQEKTDIAAIEAAYDTVRDYIAGDAKQADVKDAHDDLDKLIKAKRTPPLAAIGVQEQIVFAAKRCQNYAAKIGGVSAEDMSNVFVTVVETQLREYCAVQIHAAKLRLIDYGVANGVDPFAE